MYRNILVALDGSTHGEAALNQAVFLAHRFKAHLTGIHVLDTGLLRGSFLHDFSGTLGLEPQMHLTGRLEAFLEERAGLLLRSFQERCEKEGIPFRTLSPTGDVAETLGEAADLQDLVVLGRRGASYDTDPSSAGGRNTARQMLRQGHTPMLLTGTRWSPLQKLVVAYDGSPGSHLAIKDAVRLATGLQIPITCVHVQEPGTATGLDPLAEAERYLAPYGVEARFVSREGPRINTLSRLLEEEQADLIFVGYQGSSRLRELFVGHAPDVLLNWVTCPIWVSK